jgi:hypothetical protein
MHPDRAARISTMPQVDGPAPHPERERLPPDVEAAHKTRINNDLIKVFRCPCPPNTVPCIQGIGLYTHVTGPPAPPPLFPHMKYTQRSAPPTFLSIGGPKQIVREGSLEGSISDDVKRAWKDVQEALDKQSQDVAHADMDVDQLKKRYGALEVPSHDTDLDQPQEKGKQPDGRRPSTGDGLAREVVMGGTDEARRGSTSATWSGNDYEAARDPRLRGRRDGA